MGKDRVRRDKTNQYHGYACAVHGCPQRQCHFKKGRHSKNCNGFGPTSVVYTGRQGRPKKVYQFTNKPEEPKNVHPKKIASETKESFGEAKDSHSEEINNEIEDFCESATEQVENLSDDEERLGEKARLMLEKLGYTVTVCHEPVPSEVTLSEGNQSETTFFNRNSSEETLSEIKTPQSAPEKSFEKNPVKIKFKKSSVKSSLNAKSHHPLLYYSLIKHSNCVECKVIFKSTEEIRKHMKEYHSFNVECQHCHFTSNDSVWLDYHMLRKHNQSQNENKYYGYKCAVQGCNTTNLSVPKQKLFRIPNEKVWKLKRDMWISAIREVNGVDWLPKDRHRICSKHFKSGQHTNIIASEDYVPNCTVSNSTNHSKRYESTKEIKSQNGKDSDEKTLSEVNDITEKNDGKIEVDYVPHVFNDEFDRFSKKQKILEAKQSSVPKEKDVDAGLAQNCKWQKLYGPKQCFNCSLMYSSAYEHSKYCKSVVTKNDIPKREVS